VQRLFLYKEIDTLENELKKLDLFLGKSMKKLLFFSLIILSCNNIFSSAESSNTSSSSSTALPFSRSRAEVIAQAEANSKKFELLLLSLSPLNEKPEREKTAADRCINYKCLHHQHSFDRMNELFQLKKEMRDDEKRSLAAGKNHAHMRPEQSRDFDPGLHRKFKEPVLLATITTAINKHGREKYTVEHHKNSGQDYYTTAAAVQSAKSEIHETLQLPFAHGIKKQRPKDPRKFAHLQYLVNDSYALTDEGYVLRPQANGPIRFNVYSDKEVREFHPRTTFLWHEKKLFYRLSGVNEQYGLPEDQYHTAIAFIEQNNLKESPKPILFKCFVDGRQSKYEQKAHVSDDEKEIWFDNADSRNPFSLKNGKDGIEVSSTLSESASSSQPSFSNPSPPAQQIEPQNKKDCIIL